MTKTPPSEAGTAMSQPPSAAPERLLDRSFLALCAVSLSHNLGEKLFFVFLVYLSPASNILVSFIYLAAGLPAILFGSVAGVVVDRFSLRTLMAVTSILRMIQVATLPLVGHDIGWLLFHGFLFSFITRFFDPAFMKAIPTLVAPRYLMTANSVFMTMMVGALIGSFALSSPVWNWTLVNGQMGAHWVVVGLYAIATISTLLIRFPARQDPAPHQESTSFFDEWRFAFEYLQTHPRLLRAYGMTMTLFGTIAAVNVIARGFAEVTLHPARPTDFTYIQAFAGIGMVLMAGILARWGQQVPKGTLIQRGFVVAGGALIGMGILGAVATSGQIAGQSAWNVAFALAIALGVGAAAIELPVSTLVQEGVEPHVRGRIFGVQAMLMNLASTLPMALVGYFADLWGPVLVMGLLGGQMAITAFRRL